MAQSNYIAAALAIAFFVYITAKGSLKNYLSILTGESGFVSDTKKTDDPTTVKPGNGSDAGATTPDQKSESDSSDKNNSSNPFKLLSPEMGLSILGDFL